MIALTHVACLPDRQTFGKCDIGKLTIHDKREFEAVLANLPTQYLQIFTRHPYTSRSSQLSQILKEL
jgi:hypothetical protein